LTPPLPVADSERRSRGRCPVRRQYAAGTSHAGAR